MENSSDRPFTASIGRYLQEKGKGRGGESGSYRRDAARELERFQDWLEDRDTDLSHQPARANDDREPHPIDLNERVFRDYASYLSSLDLSPSTVKVYYSYISAWVGWLHRNGDIERHYAATDRAREPLPDNNGRRPGDQQMWSAEQRDELIAHTTMGVEKALDNLEATDHTNRGQHQRSRYQAILAARDRALTAVVAYSGIRGAEFLRDPDDDRPERQGSRWEDLSLADQSLEVYSKSQEWDSRGLPRPVIHPLRQYRQLLKPPEKWPIFPTFHAPTLTDIVEDLDGRRDEYARDILLARDEGRDVPALSTNGARRIMERLTDEAGIDVDGEHNYLVLHGGRRGMGEIMVRKYGYTAAARFLDNSEKMVRDHYSHIEAGEKADLATEALEETDRQV